MECQKNGCNNEGSYTCRHCHKAFCSIHIRANMPSMPTLDSLHFKPTPVDGHACTAYRGSFNPNKIFASQDRNTRHSHIRSDMDKALPVKAFFISLSILFLLMPSVGFLHMAGLAFEFDSFSSLSFIKTFIVVFFVILMYDYITARRKFLTQEVYGSLAASVILTTSNLVLLQYSFSPLIKDILVLFVVLYAAFWICNRKKIRRVLQFLGVLFVLIIFMKFLLASDTGSFTSLQMNQTNQSRWGNLLDAVNATLQQINPTINSAWVGLFFSNVSMERGLTYSYCPALGEFARTRFSTMTAGNNWQISHYGFSNDSASFMSGRYYYYTGEVVLYPHGHASDYLSEIMAQAPGHYALLMDKEFSYYGYYISSGPVVSAYQPCSVTEIPGPDINEVQFYQSYGCQTTTSDATWFVVDLSAGC